MPRSRLHWETAGCTRAWKKWARELGKENRASLTAYLSAAQPIAALSGSQTRDSRRYRTTGLTADELAVCTAMGITIEAFKAAKET